VAAYRALPNRAARSRSLTHLTDGALFSLMLSLSAHGSLPGFLENVKRGDPEVSTSGPSGQMSSPSAERASMGATGEATRQLCRCSALSG
jgi:hypothetical protein